MNLPSQVIGTLHHKLEHAQDDCIYLKWFIDFIENFSKNLFYTLIQVSIYVLAHKKRE